VRLTPGAHRRRRHRGRGHEAPVARTALGVGGPGPRRYAPPGRGRRGADPGPGPTPGASGHPGDGATRGPVVADRWGARRPHRAADARRPLEATRAPPGPRAPAATAVDARARAAVGTRRHLLSASTPAQGHPPCRVWPACGHRATAGHARRADPDRLGGALDPGLPPPPRRSWAAGQHAGPTRRGTAPPAGTCPAVASCRLTARACARAPVPGGPRAGVRPAVAAADARAGRRPDHAGGEAKSRAEVACAPVAAAPGP
jgi:hypothetical protein